MPRPHRSRRPRRCTPSRTRRPSNRLQRPRSRRPRARRRTVRTAVAAEPQLQPPGLALNESYTAKRLQPAGQLAEPVDLDISTKSASHRLANAFLVHTGHPQPQRPARLIGLQDDDPVPQQRGPVGGSHFSIRRGHERQLATAPPPSRPRCVICHTVGAVSRFIGAVAAHRRPTSRARRPAPERLRASTRRIPGD